MSELIKNHKERLDGLCSFAHKFVDGENGKVLVKQYEHLFSDITPMETMQVFDTLLGEDMPFEQVKSYAAKLINVFSNGLLEQTWDAPVEPHFLYWMMQENRRMETLVAEYRPDIRRLFKSERQERDAAIQRLRNFVRLLESYELHYIKKEHILFPYLEQAFSAHRCLQLMWSFHDDFRKSLKVLRSLLESTVPDLKALNTELGRLFFVLFPIVFREEYIVFPVAHQVLSPSVWDEMLRQSYETGWCYDLAPAPPPTADLGGTTTDRIDLGTGCLSVRQLTALLNHLPVDITLVDEADTVQYFSGGKHRIFARSKAIIGRKVQNCHPHESVHVVNEIVESFRNGRRDVAEFWIQMKERFVHIRYFALRDEDGTYLGTAEVSQDVTDIRALKGEKRLLDDK